MTTQILIEIGTEGLYRLKVPFDSLIPAQTSFTCKAVRKLSEILSSGVDAFAEYYLPRGLSQNVYSADLAADVSIVSLTSALGQWVYVPTSYILGYPDVNGVGYTAVMLGLSLGPLPDGLPLDALKTGLTNLTKDIIGVTCVIKEITVSAPAIIPHDEHVIINTARLANITINQSDRAKLTKAIAERDAARAKITELENYIKAHLPP